MLLKAIVENFRCHKRTVTKFSPGLNIFIGESDTGKTALISALFWNFLNKPYGDSFRSNWGGDTKVITFFSDTPKIQRVRTNSKNYYKIPNSPPLTALGKGGVPEQISNLINLGDINIQYCGDSNYLFNSSPPEVAKYLNQLVDLEIISSSLSNVDSEKRKLEGILKFEITEQEKIEKELKTFKWIDKAEHTLKILEQISRDIQNLIAEKKAAEKIFSSISKNKIELKKLENTLSIKTKVEELIALEKHINKEEKRQERGKVLFKSIVHNKEQIKLLYARIKRMRKALPKICPFCKQPITERSKI